MNLNSLWWEIKKFVKSPYSFKQHYIEVEKNYWKPFATKISLKRDRKNSWYHEIVFQEKKKKNCEIALLGEKKKF